MRSLKTENAEIEKVQSYRLRCNLKDQWEASTEIKGQIEQEIYSGK